MAIKSNETFKGIKITGAYIKALVSLDVAIYKNQTERDNNNCLGNKRIQLSDASMAKIYQIVKDEAYPEATDLLDEAVV